MKKLYFKRLIALTAIFSLLGGTVSFAANKGTEIKRPKTVSEDETAKTDNTLNEKGVRVIGFNEALKLAEKNNSSLKTLVESLEIMEDQKEKLVRQYSTLSASATGGLNPVEVSFVKGIDSLTTGISSSETSKKLINEATTLTVMSLFDNLENAKNGLSIAEKNYDIAKKELETGRIKKNLNMISSNDLFTLENAAKKAALGVESKKSEITIAKNTIRRTLGLNEHQEFELIDRDYTYEKVEEIIDIVSHANVAANTSLKVKTLEDSLKSAEKNKNIYLSDGSSTGETYDEKVANVNKASRNVADAKADIRTAVINTYNNIKIMEESIAVSEKAYQEALMDYKTAEINYNLGNIPKLTLDKAQLGVESAKNQYDTNLRNYSLLKYRFEHPSLLQEA